MFVPGKEIPRPSPPFDDDDDANTSSFVTFSQTSPSSTHPSLWYKKSHRRERERERVIPEAKSQKPKKRKKMPSNAGRDGLLRHTYLSHRASIRFDLIRFDSLSHHIRFTHQLVPLSGKHKQTPLFSLSPLPSPSPSPSTPPPPKKRGGGKQTTACSQLRRKVK